jgi:hypothetical protein
MEVLLSECQIISHLKWIMQEMQIILDWKSVDGRLYLVQVFLSLVGEKSGLYFDTKDNTNNHQWR